jgi:uncharacterized damage-inducible protein DinB
MSTPITLLDEILDDWYVARKGLIKELNNIPPARFSFRATLEMRSVTEVVQHVLEMSIMTVEELLREDTNFHRAPFSQLLHYYAPNIYKADTQQQLIDLLVEQYKDSATRWKNGGTLFLLQLVTRTDGSKGTRMSVLQEAIAHENYHRGQLTVYARLLGLVPVLTKELERPTLPPINGAT